MLSLAKYLSTGYEPDCDYVDGTLEERNTGEQIHSLVMGGIAFILHIHRHEFRLRSLIAVRVRTTLTRIRVADVCAVPSDRPLEGILTTSPTLCVEVLSPLDKFQHVVLRAQEFHRMGVPNIWIIDSESREAWTMSASGGVLPMMDDAFTIPGTPVRVAIADIFEEIDNAPKT